MTPEAIEEVRGTALALGCRVCEDEPMSRHTTFRIGGPARLFVQAGDGAALADIRRRCLRLGLPLFVLGGGSNLLVSDAGFDGVVLQPSAPGLRCCVRDGNTVTAGAAVRLGALCEFARDHGLSGLEFAHGIPGTVGGAVFMNAGAYGGEMKDTVADCRYLDADSSEAVLAGEALEFGYRRSAFTANGGVVLSARFSLTPDDPEAIGARMRALLERRRSKQPLELPSAGSVFKRPQGNFAGTLIEQCGLKGAAIGGAQVSEKHAGFIVNRGGATCGDVRRLIERIRETVLRQTGVSLECELRFLGGDV